MSSIHLARQGFITKSALPNVTRQRGTTTAESSLMLYGAGKTTVSNNTTFVDGSTNNFTITRNGDTVQSGFNPFSGISNGAGFFDGTGDSLSNASANLTTTGNITVEFWAYLSSASGLDVVVNIGNEAPARWSFAFNNGAPVLDRSGSGTTTFGSAVSINTWHHVAFVRLSNTVSCYVNGVSVGTPTSMTGTIGNTSGFYVGAASNSANPFQGYISNLRVVTSAVYTSNFTPPTSPLTAITNTSLLLLMENYSIVNSTSTNLPITISGGATISTTQAPTGMSSSMYFNSATASFVQTPSNIALNVSSGNYTVEGWVYLDMATYSQFDLGGRGIVSDYLANGNGRWLVAVNPAGRLEFVEQDAIGSNSVSITDSSAIALQQWVYFAAVKSGTTMYLFKNGVSVGTATSAVRTAFPGRINVGQYTVDTNFRGYFLGYISNIRLSKGTAVYTSNFTTPTAPLPLSVTVPNFVTNSTYGVYQLA